MQRVCAPWWFSRFCRDTRRSEISIRHAASETAEVIIKKPQIDMFTEWVSGTILECIYYR